MSGDRLVLLENVLDGMIPKKSTKLSCILKFISIGFLASIIQMPHSHGAPPLTEKEFFQVSYALERLAMLDAIGSKCGRRYQIRRMLIRKLPECVSRTDSQKILNFYQSRKLHFSREKVICSREKINPIDNLIKQAKIVVLENIHYCR